MARRLLLFAVTTALCLGAYAQGETVLDSEDDKTLYALGMALSLRLKSFDLSAEEAAIVQRGFGDGVLGREGKVDLEAYGPKIDGYLRSRMEALSERRKEAGRAFVETMAQEAGAVKTESGMVYIEQQAGSGPSPSGEATVQVHYTGTFPDGEVFDTSREKDEPATFSLDGVVACFSEGIGRMKVGGRSKLVCPPDLAYGERGFAPGIPPGATLVFEVELVGIVDQPEPEAAPDVTP